MSELCGRETALQWSTPGGRCLSCVAFGLIDENRTQFLGKDFGRMCGRKRRTKLCMSGRLCIYLRSVVIELGNFTELRNLSTKLRRSPVSFNSGF